MNTILKAACLAGGMAALVLICGPSARSAAEGRDKEGQDVGGLQMRRYRSSPNLGRPGGIASPCQSCPGTPSVPTS